MAADSRIQQRRTGEGWLAVGDAAMAYDPLASHGLQMAMVGGREAAKAIAGHFSGNGAALGKYQELMYWAFHRYVEERTRLYAAERRFLGSAYWRERNGVELVSG